MNDANQETKLKANTLYTSETSFLRLSEVVSALTYALDITEGQPEGHALRSCIIGMRIGEALALDAQQRSNLYYALLLKDLGCSSTSSKVRHLFGANDQSIKAATKTINFHHKLEGLRFVFHQVGRAAPLQKRLKYIFKVAFGDQSIHSEMTQIRCERGADIARAMGFQKETANAIRALDEHWNGKGRPYQLKEESIPLLGRILCLAQTVAVFYQEKGPDAALTMAKARAGSWFDPAVVKAFENVQQNPLFWAQLEDTQLETQVSALEPPDRVMQVTEARLDTIAEAFASVIDAKSPWTYQHSERVKKIALGAASQLKAEDALSSEQLKQLSRAALLHDIGKLGVSNLILEKPERLSDTEYAAIRLHPSHGEKILSRLESFNDLLPFIASHHERMDGAGYPEGIAASELAFEVRLLSVADQFEALTSKRPYRQAMSVEAALAIIKQEAVKGVDPKALVALERFLSTPEAALLLKPKRSSKANLS